MGISERKEREKEELQKLILETATQLFIEKGFEKTSMRNIAEAIEYSVGTIYLYYKDKSELFHAIHSKGFQEFFKYLSKVMVIEEPMERLDQLGRQYLRFAIENPGYYDLMFIMRTPMESSQSESDWEEGDTSHKILTSTVADCLRAGYFKGLKPEVVSFMIWAQVHGICSMMVRDRMRFYPEDDWEDMMFNAKGSFMHLIRRV
ncbi:TetR family transcriptional regulator [Roseivirga sp. 4D4]|uniref:TetR/AcrR family transcriptional regulator n=1 Tax=Roseivirga sp. 4D4 TaxID=1889784 RepID=UPI000852A0B9|nr:TetR/AcrR family transcriptional regulator [Roseivirga sp. 4D4]OEK01661.1 TetR family transcriptional regulator [Roseivirga sp. 4D4]